MNTRQFAIILTLFLAPLLPAQQNRLAEAIRSEKSVALQGNIHPKALPQVDRGPVDPALQLNLVTLALKPTPRQEADLQQLLAEQQDRSSPNYRRWLTPEQYADQFGLSAADIAKVRAWLESQGFTIDHVARSRNWIAFSGTAGQIATAFQTVIHRYSVDGEMHFANSTEPMLPAALEPLAIGFLGLDDFRPEAPTRRTVPRITLPSGTHVLAPDDLATIYDITRLYQAGFDGTGTKIAVAGQSDINLADIASFRSDFSLPANVPQVVLVPGSKDPGTTGDENEADLDIEWAGAVARNATIIYVNSTNAVVSSAHAISENLAPVVSLSFGGCEAIQPTVARASARSIASQGNSQGITWIAASGDAGAAGCDRPFSSPQASKGLAISFPASLPEVTAVGGTSFTEGTGAYWGGNSQTLESALAYIPETAWNESGPGGLASTGGGFSLFYAQPSWQMGPGLPPIAPPGGRAQPDVALASALHDGYAVVSAGEEVLDYGTSTATPVFAGIIALLNQKEATNGVGNINQNLYRLAQTNAFHDITTGSNVVQCVTGTTDCTSGLLGYNAAPGYDPVTGLGSVDAFNLVMQWNAATPVSSIVAASTPSPVPAQLPVSQGQSWFYTVSLTETAGVATSLTGFTVNGVDFSSQISALFGSSTIPANGTISINRTEPATIVSGTVLLFGFTGVDAGGRQWSQQLPVQLTGASHSSGAPTIGAVANAGSFQVGLAEGALASLFGTHLSPASGVESPGGAISYKGVSITVGGHLAPLFAVANVGGQEQINFQVPTEAPVSGASGIVQINNNGAIASTSIATAPIQPGVFEYVPSGSNTPYGIIVKLDGTLVGPSNPAPRGSVVVMYATGLGPTSPALATNQPGPVPPAYTINPVIVTVSSIGTSALFSGAAPFFIGLNQVNFTVPVDATVGPADTLTVTVNDVTSPGVAIAIQ